MAFKRIHDISVHYAYQFICGGTPTWPNTVSDLGEEEKKLVTSFCLPLKNLVPERVTLINLSKNPEKFIPVLSHILSEYEVEHKNHHSFDVRRLPLPRLFGLFPTPSLHFRSITMSAPTLSAFLKKPVASSYNKQLEMFTDIINFKMLRFDRYI